MNRNLRVFVVDDMPMIAYTLSAVLRDYGFSVFPFTDPIEALSKARSFTPDALISDVEMPGLNGVELALQMQELCPRCRILLMSGHPGPIPSLENARTMGFYFTLFEKPLSASNLAAHLNNVSDHQLEPTPPAAASGHRIKAGIQAV